MARTTDCHWKVRKKGGEENDIGTYLSWYDITELLPPLGFPL